MKNAEIFIKFMHCVMEMHGQVLRYNGIALLSVGFSSKAEQYSVTYINCQRIVLHEYHGPLAVSLCRRGNIVICHTHSVGGR